MKTDQYLDEIGTIIINDLQKLKLKFDKKEHDIKIYNRLYIGSAFGLLAYIILYTIVPYWDQYNILIGKLISNVNHYFFIVIIVTFHFRINYLKEKSEKAEKEYHALRCEVIQRAEDLWPHGAMWEKRHLFFKEMKDKHNINLYYENPK